MQLRGNRFRQDRGRSRYSDQARLALWILLGLGLVLLVVAVVVWHVKTEFRRSAVRADGTVVEMSSHRSVNNGRTTETYCPTVEFADADGRITTFDTGVCSSPARYEVGDGVTVLYQPGHPENAAVDGMDDWLVVIFLAFAGCVLLVIGIVVAIRAADSG